MIDQKLSKSSAYENVKAKVCHENQEKWGFFKHLETKEIIVENRFGVLPWHKAVSDVRQYRQQHNEMKHFIRCLDHCFDLRELLANALQRLKHSYMYIFLIESLAEARFEAMNEVKDFVNAQDYFGRTRMLQACVRDDSRLALALIRLGSDVNAEDADGDTALHWGAIRDNVEVVRILVEKGSDVNAEDAEGNTALHWAAINNSVGVARILIENGADKDAKGSLGNTALHLAVIENSVKVARFLIGKGANTNAKNDDGWTAFDGHMDIADLL